MSIWDNNFFSQYMLPGMYARRVEKRLLIPQFIEIEKADKYTLPSQHIKETAEFLKLEIKEQFDRKQGLEDKIKSILFVISVAITAITFCLKDIDWSRWNWLSISGLSFIGLSIFYFLSSALLSIKALIPIPFYEPHPKVKFDTIKKTVSYESVKSADDLKLLAKYKLLNDNINLRIQNTTSAVLQLLQNGMVLFALFFGIAIWQKIIKPVPFKSTVIKASIRIYDDSVKEISIPISAKADTIFQIQIGTSHSQLKVHPLQKADIVKPRLKKN
jgi:hypothetical protein